MWILQAFVCDHGSMPQMLQIGEISAQILPFSRPDDTHLGLEDCKATIHFSKVAHGKGVRMAMEDYDDCVVKDCYCNDAFNYIFYCCLRIKDKCYSRLF